MPNLSNAIHNEKFSQFMCKFISNCKTIEECTYNIEEEILVYQTREGKVKKVLCLWYEQNDNNKVIISDADWAIKDKVDYVIIGYGQYSTNPRLYYYIPIKKFTRKIQLNKMNKYLLSYPLYNNKF